MSTFPNGIDGDAHEEPATPNGPRSPQAEAAETAAATPGGEAGEGEAGDLARLAAERDEFLDALRRLQAEFDNYRKRTARQQSELVDRATEGLLERLLPVLDAFDLALHHHAGGESGAEDLAAFGQIASLLRDLLAKDGLERIDAVGVHFDPAIHDAVAHLPAPDQATGPSAPASPGEPGERAPAGGGPDDGGAPASVVAEVLRAGYRLKGRVLRPAMVTVQG